MKQVIIIREDLNLSKGKMAAQASHAAVNASNIVKDKEKNKWNKWMDEGGKKIILKAKSTDQLYRLKEIADKRGLATSLIKDAGHTEISPGTVTALGIGPAHDEEIDAITGDLDTY